MTRSRLRPSVLRLRSLVALASLALLAACGGSGGGGSRGTAIEITSAGVIRIVDPAYGVVGQNYQSGQEFQHPIEFTGGCGGPYLLTVLSGNLPNGTGLDNASTSIQGVLLAAGSFSFTIQVTDVGCTPFLSATKQFTWTVEVGALRIVGANPPMFPAGTDHPVHPSLAPTVYNQFNVVQFVIAGGVGPYVLDLVDRPEIPDDGALPQGVILQRESASIVGAPVEVPDDGGPFILSFRATDAVGATAFITVAWQILTPPLILLTTALPNGACGEAYSERFDVVDGVPPFVHSLVEQAGTVTYPEGGGAPIVTPPQALTMITPAIYPAPGDMGPAYDLTDPGAPPEGIALNEATGVLAGIPRRRGSFVVNYFVRSSLVPNAVGQMAWTSAGFSFTQSTPLTMDPGITMEGMFRTSPPFSTLPEAEVTLPYNPDVATHPAPGLLLLATGGVGKDGLTDAPHVSQLTVIEGSGPAQELIGALDWTVDWDPDGQGWVQPGGVEFVPWQGILHVPDANVLVPQGYQNLEFEALDQQLPLGARNSTTETVRFSVGPDRVVITESATSSTRTNGSGLDSNDHAAKVRVLMPFSGAPQIRDLVNATDLAGAMPATAGSGTTLNTLLGAIDILRVTVNPTGWWDDVSALNPKGARPFQHGDPQKNYAWSGNGHPNGSDLNWQPNVTAVRLGACTSAAVTHAPPLGVYKDGGKLYAFDSAAYFGLFIVRSDGKISIPFAVQKSSNPWQCFGDCWTQAYGTATNTFARIPQMAVSPDGRFGVMKLRTSQTDQYQLSSVTKVVLFSLTGDTPFGGAAYKVIDTGASGNSTNGTYQFAASLTLTNQHLYYLCGNWSSTYTSWRDHFIYRYEVLGGATAGSLMAPNFNAEWTNVAGQAMQTAFQKFDSMTTLQTTFAGGPTSFAQITVMAPNIEMHLYDGANVNESSVAPHPFRVSADGKACAILAARTTASTSGTEVMKHHVWMDYEGTLRQLSSVRRGSPGGGSRGYSLGRGPNAYYHWGAKQGPTPGLEVSDDGLKVAVVVGRDSSISSTSTSAWPSRQDIVAFTSTSGTWASANELQVTGTESATAPVFSTSQVWRFGSLVFTKDGNGLVFWAGYSSAGPSVSTTSSTYWSHSQAGSLYSYDFGNGEVNGILTATEGGNTDGHKTYSSTTQVNPGTTAWSANGGVIKPVGGFLTKNREFFYLANYGALTSSEQTNLRLVGVNVRSLDTAQSINGKTDGRGFKVDNWPNRRGFISVYYHYNSYGIQLRYYAPGKSQGGGMQVMATDSGRVFFASHYQASGPANAQSTSFGGPIHSSYYFDYGSYSGNVEAFDAEIAGPVQRLTNPSLAADTSTYMGIAYVDVNDSGKAASFVVYSGSYQRPLAQERVGYIGGIDFAADGTLQPGSFFKLPTTSQGRAGESMSHDSTGTRLYFAFGAGASNENQKVLWEARFDPSDGSMTTRSFGAQRRYNVLHSGR